MEDTVCSVCGRGMSLKDLEKGSFRTVGDKLYCPECLLKKGHPKKMRCPHCAQQTTAVLHDGKYTCTHCGRQIGGEQQSGVIDSALPAANRGAAAAAEIPTPPPARIARRRKNRKAEVVAILLGCFMVSTLVLVAFLVRTRSSRPEPSKPVSEQAPTHAAVDKKPSPDEIILHAVDQWSREHPKEYQEAIDNYNTALRILKDPAARQQAIAARDKLREEMKLTAERDDQSRRIRDLEAKLANALMKIEKLKMAPVATPDTGTTADTPAHETTPTADPTPAPPADKPQEREAEKAYQLALAESRRLVGDRRHGLAMKTMETIAKTLAGTNWAKQANDERLRIQSDAVQLFNKQAERADELVHRGDYAGARKLYDELQGLDVPIVQQLIQGKLDEIRGLEEKATQPRTTPPTTAEPPAAVRQLIELLKTGTGLERGEAARKLGTLGDTAAVPQLIAALKDSEWLVRAFAAKSLGQLGDTRAVPALIETLDDERESVWYDATEALKALTKQSFSRAEKAKWLAWYEANKATLQPAQAPKPSEPVTSFPSAVVGLRYDTNVITFSVPEGVVVKAGAKIRLILGGEHVCNVEVNQIAAGEAYGKITNLKPGMKLEPGDKITVQMLP